MGAELQLVDRSHREAALRSVLESLQADYDYVVVDAAMVAAADNTAQY